MPLSDYISYDIRSGEPVKRGNLTLVPFARALEIRIPGLQGGLEWVRPDSMLVYTDDGREDILHVRDVTRIVQLSILGAGLFTGLLIWQIFRNRNHSVQEV